MSRPLGDHILEHAGTALLFKAAALLVHSRRVWESIEAVELATMGWVHGWNTARLHEGLSYPTPAEVGAAYTHDRDVAPVAS